MTRSPQRPLGTSSEFSAAKTTDRVLSDVGRSEGQVLGVGRAYFEAQEAR